MSPSTHSVVLPDGSRAEAKPCPFCGGEPELNDPGEAYPFVMCREPECNTFGPHHNDPAGALRLWNVRQAADETDPAGRKVQKETP